MKFPTLISFFLLEIFLFLLDKLRKRHKFTHILQLPCEQEDFNSSNKFLHVIVPITEQR